MTATGELATTEAALALAPIPVSASVDVEGDTPNITTPAYTRSEARWKICRDLMLGTEAIRKGGTTYLPKHASEGSSRYNSRRLIAALFNGYQRTVLAAVGLLTQEEPVLGKDMPQQLVDLWENIDGSGTHGAVFAARLAQDGMVDGFAGIITEYPRANDPRIDRSKASLAATVALETGADLDAADEKLLGLRPYFIALKADAVVHPVYETVNGQDTLVMFVVKEVVTERKGRFGVKSVTRYRIYELIRGHVFYERWTETDGRPARDEGPTRMRNISAIPWSPLIMGIKVGPNEYMPPLMPLADLNIEHHNIKTDILTLQNLACVPTPVRIGAEPDKDGVYPPLVLGPTNTIEVPAMDNGPTTPVYWLSPPVAVLEPAMKSLENTKAEMGAMGATFLAPQKVQETATAKRMDAGAEQATLSRASRALKDCLESAFGYAGQYMRLTAGSVTLADNFTGEGIDPAYMAVIVSAYQEGSITMEELRHVLHTGQLPETFDSQDVIELMANAAAKQDQAQMAAQADAGDSQPPRRKLKLTRDESGRASGIEEVA